MAKTLPDYIPETVRSHADDVFEDDCSVCGEMYVAAVSYSCGWHNRSGETYLVPCPSCGYNPEIEREIEDILSSRISVSIDSSRRKVRFNSSELCKMVLDKVREFWPQDSVQKGVLENERSNS